MVTDLRSLDQQCVVTLGAGLGKGSVYNVEPGNGQVYGLRYSIQTAIHRVNASSGGLAPKRRAPSQLPVDHIPECDTMLI